MEPPKLVQITVSGIAGGMSFQEVSGLDAEAEPIEYRHGDSPGFSTVGMPGIGRPGSVAMKKGVFRPHNEFWNGSAS